MESIVVTDGFTLNSGDIEWRMFESFGEVVVYPRTSSDEVIDRCRNATIIITNKTPISVDVIKKCSRLKFIAVTATGYNVVDIASAAKRNVSVCNVPGYGTDSVAQHTIALLLAITNAVGPNVADVAKGGWSKSHDWCYTTKPIIELSGKILGIVGYGRIGRKVAEIARAFGTKVIFCNRTLINDEGSSSLEEVFRKSDFISLHCPLTADNNGFINSSILKLMKPSAFLINTARGQLINEADLRDVLINRKIAGAALDVLSVEPPPVDHPLLGIENCLITPHNAWLSFEARKRIFDITHKNIESYLQNAPQNLVTVS
ncbi:MAG TPA: D-2-hydroxyacid dehydrogenase [Chryseosolibacter sp.]|nr:D-2-hydroxyacid dehydrogenase [Chryseosolibacter sp.]